MKNQQTTVFKQNLDYYWKSLAVYSVIFIFYAIFIGSIEDGTFKVVLKNPVVILLGLITFATLISLLYRWWRERAIIISNSSITFKSRFSEKEYPFSSIKMIIFTRERIFRTKREFGVIKFVINGRKRNIRVRPSSFDDQYKLVQTLKELKARIKNV